MCPEVTPSKDDEIQYINFNQDCSSLAVGYKSSYKLFTWHQNQDIPECVHHGKDYEDPYILERLFSSSLVAIVALNQPRKLRICHFKKGTEICNYSYSNSVLRVKLNRARLVVCLEDSLFIHSIRDMKIMHTIRDTPLNSKGLCALSAVSESSLLAYPGSSTVGEIQIFDAYNLHSKTMIAAHDSPLAAIVFNHQGDRIASASEKGTVIRVFNATDGTKLYEFRRGMKRCVTIASLVFSLDNLYLACSSNTETVHVFRIQEESRTTNQDGSGADESWMGYLSTAVRASANYLPTQVTDVFNQGRPYVSVHLPYADKRNAIAILQIQRMTRLFIGSSDGNLYVYTLQNGESGMECPLWKQYKIGSIEVRPDCRRLKSDKNKKTAFETGQERERTYNLFEANETTVYASILKNNENAFPESEGRLGSYAGVLKGHPPTSLSESDIFNEMSTAVAEPPRDAFRLDDDSEFPPV